MPGPMQAVLDSTWRVVQPELRARVGGAVHAAWLAGLRPLALERGTLHLEAPNRMTCERVRQLYAGLIAELVSDEMGTAIAVSVEPQPESLVPDELEVGPSQPIVDQSNRNAWLVLRALLEGRELPARQFLFHGPPGAGKTFLVDWWRAGRRERVRVFDGPGLVRTFQAALRDGRVPGLVAELVAADDLVIDEVHRIAGHRRIQREVAKVLDQRRERATATILVSRWHPRDIRDCEEQLVSWLMSGFVTRIEPPGPQARLTYLRALEGTRSRNGRGGAIERLARDMQGGYPELRRAWAVDRFAMRSSRYFELVDPRSSFDRLRDRVADRFGVTVEELCGSTQRRRVSLARKALSWACVKSGLSRAEVGRYLGKTRAAISYSIKSLDADLSADPALRRTVEDLL